jgi:S1-C subfamily serine protease
LAVLKIQADNLEPVQLADSSRLEVGQWVLAVGNPLGYDHTVSVGVVSSLGRSLGVGRGSFLVDTIQTDAAINPGNSGGALTDVNGSLVGINSAIASTSGGSIGIGFAIPANRVKRIMNDILTVGYARYGTLGIQSRLDLDGILSESANRDRLARLTGSTTRPPSSGVLISYVSPGSPAAKAGIQQGDVLISIGNQAIDDSLALNRVLVDRRPGDKVDVRFWSKGQTKSVQITLTDSRPEA